jgi:hypothetical protein
VKNRKPVRLAGCDAGRQPTKSSSRRMPGSTRTGVVTWNTPASSNAGKGRAAVIVDPGFRPDDGVFLRPAPRHARRLGVAGFPGQQCTLVGMTRWLARPSSCQPAFNRFPGTAVCTCRKAASLHARSTARARAAAPHQGQSRPCKSAPVGSREF